MAVFHVCETRYKSMAVRRQRTGHTLDASCHTSLWRWSKDRMLYGSGRSAVVWLRSCLVIGRTCQRISDYAVKSFLQKSVVLLT